MYVCEPKHWSVDDSDACNKDIQIVVVFHTRIYNGESCGFDVYSFVGNLDNNVDFLVITAAVHMMTNIVTFLENKNCSWISKKCKLEKNHLFCFQIQLFFNFE